MAITIYTDGGCQHNPGPGAWAFICISDVETYRESGFFANTTNNYMELEAARKALGYAAEVLKPSEDILFYTDSQYLQKGITVWVHKWRRNGWMTTAKKPVKNRELWQQLYEFSEKLPIKWHWVPAHSDIALNEECDSLVKSEIQRNKLDN